MMVVPSVTKLLKKVDNGYELVIVASRRARQISRGNKPLTNVKEESTVTLAANEIAEGKVFAINTNKEELEEVIVTSEESEIVEEV